MASTIIKTYKKFDPIKRKMDEKTFALRGYYVVSEEEVQEYSGGKGLILGLIFLPLALLGHTKKVKVTYERKS